MDNGNLIYISIDIRYVYFDWNADIFNVGASSSTHVDPFNSYLSYVLIHKINNAKCPRIVTIKDTWGNGS